MNNEDEDLSFDDIEIPPEPAPKRAPARAPAPAPEKKAEGAPAIQVSAKQTEMRGIGNVYIKNPIGCVVEVMRRKPIGNDKWEIIRPFTGIPEGSKYAFAIMSATTTHTIKRGNFEAPAREPHPSYAAFNTCHPDRSQTIHGKIINWWEEEAWRFFLGAYQHPQGRNFSPPNGWWCRGDAEKAQRWVKDGFKQIGCPHKMCEFSQPNFGQQKNQAHCKPNLSLIAQFAWRDEKTQFPKSIFEWQSKSWNNYGNCAGMFKLVSDTARNLGLGKFPVFALPFTMTVKETAKKGKRFPEVHFSIDGDLMQWMQAMITAKDQAKQQALEFAGAKPLALAAPEGFTQDDMDRASQANLDPNYRPANFREVK